MKIAITAKTVLDDRLGRLVKGQEVELPDHKARFYIAQGMAEPYHTKVMRDRPSLAVGVPASASLPAQVSPQTMSNESDIGEKPKRGRKKKALSSQTQPSE